MSGSGGISGSSSDAANTDAMFRMLRLLSDSQTLQQEYVRLDEARKAAKEVVDQVGPAHEVLAIRAEIDDLKKQASDALEAANKQATNILTEANQQKTDVLVSAEKQKHEVEAAANLILGEAKQRRAEADVAMAAADAREKVNQDKANELTLREQAVLNRESSADGLIASNNELRVLIQELLDDVKLKLAKLGT